MTLTFGKLRTILGFKPPVGRSQEETAANEMATVSETPKAPADADSFAQYKAIRRGETVPATVPQQSQPKEQDETEVPASKSDETAPADTGAATVQEPKAPKEPRRDKKAEDRISELMAEQAKLRRELEEARKPQVQPVAATPQPATQQEPARTTEDPRPKRRDFMESAAKQHPDETYEDLADRFDLHLAEWQQRQDVRARLSRERQQQQISLDQKALVAEYKRPDFKSKLAAADAQGKTLAAGMARFVLENYSNWDDVLYHLAENLPELHRIADLPAGQQMGELAYLAVSLAKESKPQSQPQASTPAPAAPRPIIVGRTPAPPRVLSGTEPAPPPDPSQATSREEYRRARQASRAS